MGVGIVLVLSAALATQPTLAMETFDTRPACAPYSPAADPFDPSGNLALRQAALVERERNADNLSAVQQWGLGALYRLGREHPAALVDQDLAKARHYLEQAALGGQVEAFASMAELELAAGAPMEAIAWANVFVNATRVQYRGQGLGYPADLLKRILTALPPGSREAQERRIATFMQVQGDKHRARLARPKPAEPVPACRAAHLDFPTTMLTDQQEWFRIQRRKMQKLAHAPAGKVMFHLVVDPDGTVASARVLETLPTAEAAVAAEGAMYELRFNAIDASAPQREAFLPFGLENSAVRLRD